MLRYILHVWNVPVVFVVLMIVFGSSAQGVGLRTGEGLPASQDAPGFEITGGESLMPEEVEAVFEMDAFRQAASQLDVTEMTVSTGNKGADLEFRGGDLTGAGPLMVFPVTTSRTVKLSASVCESGGGSGTINFTFALEESPMVSDLLPGLRETTPAGETRLDIPAAESFVPEPATLLLLGVGLMGIIMGLRRRKWR